MDPVYVPSRTAPNNGQPSQVTFPPSQSQPVFITGGTVDTTITFSGSVHTDLGAFAIQDDSNGNKAPVLDASQAKTGVTHVLLVQHVDATGTPLTQSVLASSVNQVRELSTLSQVMNNQGTLTTSLVAQAGNNIAAHIMNSQGTLATSLNQSAQASLLADIKNQQGTLATEITLGQVLTAVTPVPAARDAFGRLRISNPDTLWDSKLNLDSAPHLWDDGQTSGSGTSSTFDKPNARQILRVSATTAGTRTRRTFRRFNYQPGKSQLVMMTFTLGTAATGITRRVGAFDNFNGLFLEQTVSAISFVIRKNGLTSETFTQSNWNTDKLDGTGASGITLDLSLAQIMFFDYEWLGVGTVRFGFVIDGQFVIAHVAEHANVTTSVYTSSPNLPLCYQLANDGTGAASTLSCICSTVISEGGWKETGYPRAVTRGVTPLTTLNNNNLYAVLGIRLSQSGSYATVYPTAAGMACTTNAALRFSLVVNPNIVGSGSVTWNSLPNSAVEYANTTTNVNIATGGTEIFCGYNVAQAFQPINFVGFFGLGQALSGRTDELWLCGQRITGTAEDLLGALNFLAQS
jgi:hypothetical protein